MSLVKKLFKAYTVTHKSIGYIKFSLIPQVSVREFTYYFLSTLLLVLKTLYRKYIEKVNIVLILSKKYKTNPRKNIGYMFKSEKKNFFYSNESSLLF